MKNLELYCVLDKGRGTKGEESPHTPRNQLFFHFFKDILKTPKVHGIQNVTSILKGTKIL